MLSSRTGIVLVLTLTVAGAAPALAQSSRYATDPDPFIYSRLGYEHRALSHEDAVLPRGALPKSFHATADRGPGYATDPDPFVWGLLGREHLSMNHPDAVMPRTHRPRVSVDMHGGRSYAETDPDFRIRAKLARENNVY